jgi:ParB family chromosome partitioning protein
MKIISSNKSSERKLTWAWYTPPHIIEAARHCMGSIDLDPASSEPAQKIVKAENYYTPETSGLTRDWHGNVWLAPPYYQPQHNQFIEKALTEWYRQRISQIIILTHTSETYADWFHNLVNAAQAICLVKGCIEWEPAWKYQVPKEKWEEYNHFSHLPKYDVRGSVFFYLGARRRPAYGPGFCDTFSQFGYITK